MTTKKAPPRFVPTLTEVVAASAAGPAPVPPPVALTEEQLVQRVMQRIDLTLDRRLREAIGTVVLEQARNAGPALRERVEAVVRQAVADAMAEETKARQRGAGSDV
jgi:hypothetical protein